MESLRCWVGPASNSFSCISLPCYRESHDILRVMHKLIYVYKWPDYGDSYQRHQKWSVTILSKLECELYLIWKYERKDEYLPVYILMFIYQLSRQLSLLSNIECMSLLINISGVLRGYYTTESFYDRNLWFLLLVIVFTVILMLFDCVFLIIYWSVIFYECICFYLTVSESDTIKLFNQSMLPFDDVTM